MGELERWVQMNRLCISTKSLTNALKNASTGLKNVEWMNDLYARANPECYRTIPVIHRSCYYASINTKYGPPSLISESQNRPLIIDDIDDWELL